jgi:hypothetical protein
MLEAPLPVLVALRHDERFRYAAWLAEQGNCQVISSRNVAEIL